MKKPNRPPALKDVKGVRKADVVPPGWFSREDCEKEWNLSQSHSIKIISEALRGGRATTKKFLVESKQRALFPVPHYRFQ